MRASHEDGYDGPANLRRAVAAAASPALRHAGVVVAFSLDWGIVTVPLVWVALDRFVVPREEAMLRERFAGFAAYAGRVRRWV